MGTMKLRKMTMRSLFTKPETIMYPVQERPAPEGLKGHIENNIEECTLCGVCTRRCPSGCLSVDKEAKTWSINRFDCLQCRLCTLDCPQNCLTMELGYQKPGVEKTPSVYEKPGPSEEELAAKEAAKQAKIKAALEAKAKREAEKAAAEGKELTEEEKAKAAERQAKIEAALAAKAKRDAEKAAVAGEE